MGKSAKAKVAEYRMSTHFGIAHAPLRLRELFFGEKSVWTGDEAGPSIIGVSAPELFGGNTKEGGVEGHVYWLPGDADQVMPEEIAARLGLTSATCPGFRGFGSLFMVSNGVPIQPPPVGGTSFLQLLIAAARRGTAGAALPGFVWGYNNPYLKSSWARVTGVATVNGLLDDFAMIGDQANPVHIIWDCITNDDWGMGAPTSALNGAIWQAAAEVIFNESFGLSMGWFQQATVEEFIGDVLDHIQATVFVNPANGLFEIKLLRNDYNPDTLPSFDESNSVLTDFQRRLWGETVNEIVVQYTNPENEDKITVTQQDLGNIIAQGGVVSEMRDYYGVRDPDLAAKLAVRDVRSAAAPLAACVLTVNRDGRNLVPGGTIKVSNQKLGISGAIFRIGEIDYGKSNDSKIRLNLLEDIFGFRVGAYFTPPETLHISGADPEPAQYTKTLTMPAFLVAQYSGAMPEDPDVFAGIMATSTALSDTSRYELLVETTSLGGTVSFESIGTRGLNARSTLTDALVAESESLIEFGATTLGTGPEIEGFVLIGGEDEEQEFAFLKEIDSNNVWTMDRGMLDTTPKAWPAGTEIWFISPISSFGDTTERIENELVRFKVLPQTSRGTLDASLAPIVEMTTNNRSNMPTRPAKVRINGFGFGDIDLVDVVEADGDLTVTWANRDRDLEETTVFKWDDDGVALPAGQTTIIRIFDQSDVLLATNSGLGGESHLLDPYDYLGSNLIRINVKSVIGGEESLQGHNLSVKVGIGGWGLNWGYRWGGNA